MSISLRKLRRLLFRNRFSREGNRLPAGKVNLEWYGDVVNLGDSLSVVVCQHLLSLRSLTFSSDSSDKKIKHLMAIGSILGGRGDFNAVVWGSGIRNFSSVRGLNRKKLYQKLDIRAVRGPFTRDALRQCGFDCPDVFGDPAILMPMIYQPEKQEKHGVVLITHYLTPKEKFSNCTGIRRLDIKTNDYEDFIKTICSAEKVVSSSLHGIILAETYGTPAVFLRQGIETETLKFFDWYYSTGRYSINVASSLDEAITMEPMTLPDLSEMQKDLLESFPYDMWKSKANSCV